MRTFISIALLLFAAILIGEAQFGNLPNGIPEVFLNLGTEIIGIIISVAVIDQLLERRRLAEDARRIATEALHDLDHHVWVWQGGGREFDLGELVALLQQVHIDDPLPSFTQNLFLNSGSRASNTLRTKPEILRQNPKLKLALTELAKLARMRDEDTHMPVTEISQYIMLAITNLTQVAGLSLPPAAPLAPSEYRQTDIKSQEWRHFGYSR